MNTFILDTSALVKHYRRKAGSEAVDTLFADAQSTLIISELSIVEFASSFKRILNRGEIDSAAFNDALARFAADTAGRLVVVSFRSDSIHVARDLILMSALKTLDALQLASALDYKALDSTFVCSDHNLIQAAHAHGLNTLNPVSSA